MRAHTLNGAKACKEILKRHMNALQSKTFNLHNMVEMWPACEHTKPNYPKEKLNQYWLAPNFASFLNLSANFFSTLSLLMQYQ